MPLWSCSQCKKRNSSLATVCGGCGTERQQEEVMKVQEEAAQRKAVAIAAHKEKEESQVSAVEHARLDAFRRARAETVAAKNASETRVKASIKANLIGEALRNSGEPDSLSRGVPSSFAHSYTSVPVSTTGFDATHYATAFDATTTAESSGSSLLSDLVGIVAGLKRLSGKSFGDDDKKDDKKDSTSAKGTPRDGAKPAAASRAAADKAAEGPPVTTESAKHILERLAEVRIRNAGLLIASNELDGAPDGPSEAHDGAPDGPSEAHDGAPDGPSEAHPSASVLAGPRLASRAVSDVDDGERSAARRRAVRATSIAMKSSPAPAPPCLTAESPPPRYEEVVSQPSGTGGRVDTDRSVSAAPSEILRRLRAISPAPPSKPMDPLELEESPSPASRFTAALQQASVAQAAAVPLPVEAPSRASPEQEEPAARSPRDIVTLLEKTKLLPSGPASDNNNEEAAVAADPAAGVASNLLRIVDDIAASLTPPQPPSDEPRDSPPPYEAPDVPPLYFPTHARRSVASISSRRSSKSRASAHDGTWQSVVNQARSVSASRDPVVLALDAILGRLESRAGSASVERHSLRQPSAPANGFRRAPLRPGVPVTIARIDPQLRSGAAHSGLGALQRQFVGCNGPVPVDNSPPPVYVSAPEPHLGDSGAPDTVHPSDPNSAVPPILRAGQPVWDSSPPHKPPRPQAVAVPAAANAAQSYTKLARRPSPSPRTTWAAQPPAAESSSRSRSVPIERENGKGLRRPASHRDNLPSYYTGPVPRKPRVCESLQGSLHPPVTAPERLFSRDGKAVLPERQPRPRHVPGSYTASPVPTSRAAPVDSQHRPPWRTASTSGRRFSDYPHHLYSEIMGLVDPSKFVMEIREEE